MNNIFAPITLNGQGNAIANLQDGFLVLLAKAPEIVPDTERAVLISGSPRERAAQTCGAITSKTVLLFQQTTQKQFQLKRTGNVDFFPAVEHVSQENRLSTTDKRNS